MLKDSKVPYKSGFMIQLSDDERRVIHKVSMLPDPPKSEAQIVLKTVSGRGELVLELTKTFNGVVAAETFAESLAKMLAPLKAPEESDHAANAKVAWIKAIEGVRQSDLKQG